MPRFEFSEGTSHKFWEIALEGSYYITTYGKIGTSGRSTTKAFDSEEEAESAYTKAIHAKTKKGYLLVEDELADDGASLDSFDAEPGDDSPLISYESLTTDEEFLKALTKNPNDIGLYLAYAEWLQCIGEPRGDLIEVQYKLLTDPDNPILRQQEAALLDEYSDLFLGPFAPALVGDMVEDIIWYMGFIRGARIHNRHEEGQPIEEDEGGPMMTTQVLASFLDHPSTAFLQDLTLGCMLFWYHDYSEAVDVIKARSLSTLQSLFFGDYDSADAELNWSGLDIAGIFDSLPRLRSLTVRSGGFHFGKIHAPMLREFETITGGLDAGAVQEICDAHWPRLERLTLQLGPHGISDASLLQDILDAKGLPALQHLGITNATCSDAFLRMLPGSKILPQLQELSFSMGTLGDDCLDFLRTHKDAFAHIQFFDVSLNFFSQESKTVLEELLPQVHFGEQDDIDEGYGERYASMYE